MMTDTRPALTAGAFNALIDDLLTTLERDGIRDPLNERVTVWCILQDLADLAGIDDDDLHPSIRACGDWPLPAA